MEEPLLERIFAVAVTLSPGDRAAWPRPEHEWRPAAFPGMLWAS